MNFGNLIPEFFWQFFGDFLVEVVIEVFEAFRMFSFEVFGADFVGRHKIAGEELVFLE